MKNICFLSILLLGCSLSQATENGFYVGAGGSWALVEEAFIDDSDLGFKMFAGYEFNKFLGFEIDYNDLGTLGDDLYFEGSDLLLSGVTSVAYSGSFLIFYPPTERFKLFMKLGVFYHEDTLTYSHDTFSTQQDENGWDLLGGVGTQFIISEQFSLRGEWERYTVGEAEIDSVTLSLTYYL